MNKNCLNAVVITEKEINHVSLIKKSKKKEDILITGLSYFNFTPLNTKEQKECIKEIAHYIKRNKLTRISLVNEDVLKYIFVIDKSENVNIKSEIFNRFKTTFDINLAEYYIDYEINVFNDKLIVFVAGVSIDYLDNLLKHFVTYDFKLLSLEVDITSLKRIIGNYFQDTVVMNIHMRKDKTIFILLMNNILFTFRELSFGYNNIMEYLTEHSELSNEELIENLKNKNSFDELPIADAMDKFTIELQRTIDFYNNQFRNEPLQKIILTGLLNDIVGIDKFLSQLFITHVETFYPLKHFLIYVELSNIEEMTYITEALGVGLRQ